MSDLPFAYKGECLLLRWSETPKGRTVTLQLDPHEGDSHPFKFLKCGENGQRMQLAAVLVGDDDQPVPPPKPLQPHSPSPEDKPRTPFREMKRSAQAALKCQDQIFRAWFCTQIDYGFCDAADQVGACDQALKTYLNIISKTDLDCWPEAGANWDKLYNSFVYRDQAHA